MPPLLRKTLPYLLIAGLLLPALWTPLQRAWARPPQAPAAQYIEPFLYPPYPGTATENSIFDHSSPNYSQTDGRIVAFTGDEAVKNCPSPPPPGKSPPQAGVCDAGYGIYWSYSVGDWLSYNGHDGIDFGVQYRPLYAAADANQVVYAGWQDPMDHSYALGLYVRLRHPNGYTTSYGHMSAVAVQTCSTAGCASIPHGEFIGYSGSTGNSTGPHLHFAVYNLSNRSVDPYGWTGESADPWPYNQRNSLWVQYPSVVPYSAGSVTVLPTGPALPYPPAVTGGLIVDDGAAGFSETPAGCWTVAATTSTQSQGGSMRYVRPVISGGATCTARWNFPSGQPAGLYAVYARIPNINAFSEGALYNIVHLGRTDVVTVNQEVFPNPYHVSDGWVWIGKYEFSAAGGEYVSLPNRTQDTASTYLNRRLGADAVRFVYLSGLVPTNTPGPTNTPTMTATRTTSGTPTITGTRTNTRTPTRTYTPSITRTPSHTRWPTWTPSLTRTLRPTDTRWPTAGPSPTATIDHSGAPSPTRTSTSTVGPSPTRAIRPTDTRWPSPTKRPTDTRWPTVTRRPTDGPSPTYTPTRSSTPTLPGMDTPGPSPTRTATNTIGPSPTRTIRPTDTRWPTVTKRPTDTRWPTRTFTPAALAFEVYPDPHMNDYLIVWRVTPRKEYP